MAKLKSVLVMLSAPFVLTLFVLICAIFGLFVGARKGMTQYMRFVLNNIEKFIV